MLRAQRLHRVCGNRDERRDFGHVLSVRPPEPERAVGVAFDLKTLLVHRAVMSTTQERQIRQRRGSALCPVPHVMPLAERRSTPGEATPAVAMKECTSDRGRNRPRSRPYLHHSALFIASHHYATRV